MDDIELLVSMNPYYYLPFYYNLYPTIRQRKENAMQIKEDINNKSEKIQKLENKVNFILATLGIAGIVWLLSE